MGVGLVVSPGVRKNYPLVLLLSKGDLWQFLTPV